MSTTKVETQTAINFIESSRIPYVKLDLRYYKNDAGQIKKDVGSCPTDWRTYNYEKAMEYNDGGFHRHKKGLNVNIEAGGYVVIDTDSKEAELWVKQRLNGRRCPTTNTMKGRHRYIKYTGRTLKPEQGIHDKIDFLTKNTFEMVDRPIKYAEHTLEMTKEELEELLDTKFCICSETTKERKKNATSPKIIERYLFENNDIIEKEKLFKIIDGLDAEQFVAHDKWLKFVIAIYNQVPCKEEHDEYYKKILQFLKRQKSYKNEYDEENFMLFNYRLPNKLQPLEGITARTIWMWLYEQNKDLWTILHRKKMNLDPVSFNKLGEYKKQRREFEKNNFKINSEKIAYIEKDVINGKDIFRTQDGLKRRYQKLKSQGEDDKKSKFIDIWLEDEYAIEYDTMDFIPPPLKTPESCYNLFSGFMIDKAPVPDGWEEADTTLIWDHLYNLAGREDDVFQYYKSWFAHRIQYPGVLPKVALVWRSPQGCGKNCFLDFIGHNIIGSEYYASTANINDYVGQFATIDKGKILCVMNEADPRDTHANMSRIKEKFTDPYILWESKGVDRFPIKNCVGYVLPTNCNNAIKVEDDDRRIMAQECSRVPIMTEDYFENLIPLLESEQHAYKFYQELKAVEVSRDYNFKRHRPLTAEYLKMKLYNIPNLVRFTQILLQLEDGKNEPLDLNLIPSHELYEYYKNYCNTCNIPCNITFHKFIIDYTNGEFKTIIKKEMDHKRRVFYTVDRDAAQSLCDHYYMMEEYKPL